MTPTVIREGNIKSHIILDASIAIPLADSKHENYNLAFYVLAHECAHVEITHRFEAAFPGFLHSVHANHHDALRWRIIHLCWDEYGATWISAGFGRDPTEDYEETFLLALNETRPKANELIKSYRLHQNIHQIMDEVYSAYGTLIKFAAYHLGNMAGREMSLLDLPRTTAALEGHWFASYFERLNVLCKQIADAHGHWDDRSLFEAIGDLADDLVVEGGVIISHLDDGRLYVSIPYTFDTMPS